MSKILRIILPVVFLIGAVVGYNTIMSASPEAVKGKQRQASKLLVDAIAVSNQSYTPEIHTFGRVAASKKIPVLSQVAGQVTKVYDEFYVGAEFQQGDVLVEIDSRDYDVQQQIAEAAVSDALALLAEEQARATIAVTDWTKLGNRGEPSDLVLRKPQVAAAQARVLSAKAQLKLAKLNVDRTKIKAPFSGKIAEIQINQGQVISAGSALVSIYATDTADVNLPLTPAQVTSLGQNNGAINNEVALVDLSSSATWKGVPVTLSGMQSESTQRVNLLVRVESPFMATREHSKPMLVGQHVKAIIKGEVMEDVIVLPTQSVYQTGYVYVLDDNRINKRQIEIAHRDSKNIVVASGVNPGEVVVVTPLGQVQSGAEVVVNETIESGAP